MIAGGMESRRAVHNCFKRTGSKQANNAVPNRYPSFPNSKTPDGDVLPQTGRREKRQERREKEIKDRPNSKPERQTKHIKTVGEKREKESESERIIF